MIGRRNNLDGKTYWLIGASAGIGAALAKELDSRGAKLILSARSMSGLRETAESLGNSSQVLPMDVSSDESVDTAAFEARECDGIIYMAGEYTPMSAQEWDFQTADMIEEVNYRGATRILSKMVPAFSAKSKGHIIIIGSLAGFSGLPGAIGYGASKSALMHLAQNLKSDLKSTGIRIQCVNPGFVKTRLTDKNDFRMPFITTPDRAARIIANHMETNRFSKSFPFLFSWFFKLRAIWFTLRA